MEYCESDPILKVLQHYDQYWTTAVDLSKVMQWKAANAFEF